MKKHLNFLSVLACSAVLCSCAPERPDYVNDRTYEAAKNVIEIVDEVIDGKMDFVTAYEKTDYYFDIIDGFDENDELMAGIAKTSADIVQLNLYSGKSKQEINDKIDDEFFSRLEDDRNSMAKHFGIEERD